MKKPQHIIAKEKAQRAHRVWLFGLHAVRDALTNPARRKHRLVVTKNALDRLGDIPMELEPEVADPRAFPAPLDLGSVHQGAAMEVSPLDWGPLETFATDPAPGVIVALDRVTDPHNVGAILRSAEVFGARAVIAPERHSAPETGALAKTASGALERQPYLRIANLARALATLADEGWEVVGLAGEADQSLEAVSKNLGERVVLVLGAEGPGLRELTRARCHHLARIEAAGGFGSLNVSNAAAVGLYALSTREV